MITKDVFKHALPAGTEIEGYVLDRVIGSGGFGITYCAKDQALDKWVALKEYFPAHLAIREQQTVSPRTHQDQQDYAYGLEQFLREGQIIAKFNHPNIVRVLRHFSANGTAYLVLEYIPGMSLKSYVDQQPNPEQNVLMAWLKSLLKGLRVVHSLNYLHRDIKPSNVYLRAKGEPVLIDFGSSRLALNRSTQSFTHMVTEGYAPFEQYPGDLPLTAATDLYSLGATFYYAVTNIVPANAITRISALRIGQTDPLKPLAELCDSGQYNTDFIMLVEWMLAVFPEHRPKHVDELEQVLYARNRTQLLQQKMATIAEKTGQPYHKPTRWFSLPMLAAGIILGIGFTYAGGQLFPTVGNPKNTPLTSKTPPAATAPAAVPVTAQVTPATTSNAIQQKAQAVPLKNTQTKKSKRTKSSKLAAKRVRPKKTLPANPKDMDPKLRKKMELKKKLAPNSSYDSARDLKAKPDTK